jgi:hypothetical protein
MALQDNPDPRKYSTYLATRPAKFEEDAAHMLIDVLVEEHIPPTRGFYLHIAHLGDAKNVEGFRVSALLLLLPSLSCTLVDSMHAAAAAEQRMPKPLLACCLGCVQCTTVTWKCLTDESQV